MNYKKIREEYSNGVSLKELAGRYSVSYSSLLRRAKKENWVQFDKFSALRQGIESLVRLIAIVSLSSEEKGEMDPRDIKYLTAAEKELFELTREMESNAGPKKPADSEKLKEIGSPASGIIFIPEIEN